MKSIGVEQSIGVILDYNVKFISYGSDDYAIAVGKVPQKRCVKEEVIGVVAHGLIFV